MNWAGFYNQGFALSVNPYNGVPTIK